MMRTACVVIWLLLLAGHLSADVPKPTQLVSAADWGSDPDPIDDSRRHTPRFVTVHHAGVVWTGERDPVDFIRGMQSWGKRRPQIEEPPRDTYWPDLPYHFLIAPDGTIYEGRSTAYEPESNTDYELSGHLGVELMGNFEEQRPSREQLDSLVELIAWLLSEHDLSTDAIGTHASVAPGQTSCPGRDLLRYFEGEGPAIAEWVQRVLDGQPANIELGEPLTDGPTEGIPTS